jgi:hypothetical protein
MAKGQLILAAGRRGCVLGMHCVRVVVVVGPRCRLYPGVSVAVLLPWPFLSEFHLAACFLQNSRDGPCLSQRSTFQPAFLRVE